MNEMINLTKKTRNTIRVSKFGFEAWGSWTLQGGVSAEGEGKQYVLHLPQPVH